MSFSLMQFSKLADAISKVGKSKLKDQVHVLAVHAVGHAKEHGDVRAAWKLTEAAMLAGLEGQALVRWFEEFGPLRLERGSDDKPIGFKFMKAKADKMAFNGEELLAGTPWYAYTKPAKELKSSYDGLTGLLAVAKRIVNEQAKGTEVGHADILPEINRILAKFGKSVQQAPAGEPAAM